MPINSLPKTQNTLKCNRDQGYSNYLDHWKYIILFYSIISKAFFKLNQYLCHKKLRKIMQHTSDKEFTMFIVSACCILTHFNLINQDRLWRKGMTDWLLIKKIIQYVKFEWKKMHLTERLKPPVPLTYPAGFWRWQSYLRGGPATLCSLPKRMSIFFFFFSTMRHVMRAPVSRISDISL